MSVASAADLVAHWTFDTDVSDCVGENHGTAHGNVKVATDAAVGAGSLSVGGRPGDYVKVESHPSLNSPSFTQMYWLKSDPKIESSIGGMCRRITGFDRFPFETDWNVHSPTCFEISWWNGSWHSAFAWPTKDTWIHLAWTYDARTQMLGLHVNGTQTSLTPRIKLGHAGRTFFIGGSYHGKQNFKGLIDDQRMYGHALGADEIQAIIREPIERLGLSEGLSPSADTVRFDFESGDLQGWRVIDGKFAKLLNDRKMFRNRKQIPFNKQGKYFLDTVESGGWDRQTGVVESPVFVLKGPTMSMMVGGGRHADTYVALCTLDGNEVLKAQGPQDEVLVRVNWRAPQLVGKQVFLRIVDGHTSGWGHVTFDDFVAFGEIDPMGTKERQAVAATMLKRRRLREQLQAINFKALRPAIEALMATFGERYASGAKFLKHIAACEARVQAVEAALSKNDESALSAVPKLLDEIREFQREALVANPLVSDQPILFVVRHQYKSDHHNTATLFQKGEINGSKFQGPAAVKTIDFSKGGEVTTLLDLPKGVARDPEIHFSGKRAIFSMRRNIDDDYHIYEVNTDGTGLKQLTRAKGVSDIDPLYLPDDSIVFSSTREPKYCMCNRHIMANLFRMDPDGANIHQIGKSTLFEGHGHLTPDGRVLYYRWEYVDRNFGDAQSLWTVNPDGTNHALYWGNNTWSPGAVIDARIIPGSEQAVCIFTSCHDRPWGAVALIDQRRGLEGREPVVRVWPASSMKLVSEHGSGYGFDKHKRVKPKYEDPYPLYEPDTIAGAGKYFLCSRMTGNGEQMGIYLIDVFGNETLLHVEDPGCYDPMPVRARPRPPVIPSRRNFDNRVGYFYVHDVYEGTHMEGVKPGQVKWLRVVESPEKRFWTGPSWGGQGTIAPAMNWHDFNNKRILGIVPVEEDGSAYFAVPADKFVFFQLLDENGMMVQSMRSGTMLQSGERTGCIGCHDDRLISPPSRALPSAAQKPARDLESWYGEPRLFSYRTEVQPVLDKHCVQCHDFGKPGAKKLILAGDRTMTFNASYSELWRKKYIKVVGAGPHAIQPAYSWGSHASKVVEVIRKGHNDVKLDKESFDRLVTWIDINAPYYPSYASAYPSNPGGRSPLDNKQVGRLTKLTGVPFTKLLRHSGNRGPQVCFDRPELSPCLAKFEDRTAPQYQEALAIIQAGKAMLAKRPRADMGDFLACPVDRSRQDKYVLRQETESQCRAAIRRKAKEYDGKS